MLNIFLQFFLSYKMADFPPPDCIWVDRGCCVESGTPSLMKIFHPWKSTLRLDIFHFIRRLGLAADSEHHPAFGAFMSHLSYAIFKWNKDDLDLLRSAKKAELESTDRNPTPDQVTSPIIKVSLTLT